MNAPFTTVKVRVAATVTHGDEVALIRRTKDGEGQYTIPGGNVEPGEPLLEALVRELVEELDLHLGPHPQLRLIAVQDQLVSRPGTTPAPRKLHLIFHVPITGAQRAALPEVEHDDLSDGAIVWVPIADTPHLHLYPAVGDLLTTMPDEASIGVLLPAMTDATYTWR